MSLMILGTSSHAGKSVITAGICRILSNLGVSVSPFKAQNMSLNSYVTEDGSEIGIAQAVQAAAARTCPSALMNPILLKPKSDGVSQIILHGRPWMDMHISKYYNETETLLNEAVSSYEKLSEIYSTIVIEGAGGAAEVNLYDRDIANILLAKRLKLPIILVADIERGGVFAQVCGTIALLPEEVRPLVKGIIINKFRGDVSLFESGRKIIEEICKVPVLGVIPWTQLNIPDEDSLSIADKVPKDSPVKIAVIRYGHIANFTDFSLLERCASAEYVPCGTSLKDYDAVILPGSKNTISDLEELKKSGAADEIIKFAKSGKPVIGICGGYQMMGRIIIDRAVEGDVFGKYSGLGLLNIETEFLEYKKITCQKLRKSNDIEPIISKMGNVRGYEIHAGITKVFGREVFDGEGCCDESGLIFGTYLHGLFSENAPVDALLSYLFEKKGLNYVKMQDSADPYEELADHLTKNLDCDALIKIASGK